MSQFSCGSEFVVCDVGTCVSAESWIAVAGPTADPSLADGRFARRAALCAAASGYSSLAASLLLHVPHELNIQLSQK